MLAYAALDHEPEDSTRSIYEISASKVVKIEKMAIQFKNSLMRLGVQ
jgi:hypothetical protein